MNLQSIFATTPTYMSKTSFKKPALVPGKANEQQQREWMTQYEKLKQDLTADETICFMDGIHPTHNVQPAYG